MWAFAAVDELKKTSEPGPLMPIVPVAAVDDAKNTTTLPLPAEIVALPRLAELWKPAMLLSSDICDCPAVALSKKETEPLFVTAICAVLAFDDSSKRALALSSVSVVT